MKKIHSKKLWAGTLAVGASAALGLTLVTSSAPADSEKQRSTATIEMVQNGDELSFDGPETVSQGEVLRIVNSTDPQQIGPHTFSLTKQNLIPSNGDEAKDCIKVKPESVCKKIFKAHEVDFEKEKVGKKKVDSGKLGWNLLFRDQGEGDSWVALKEGAEDARVVSGQVGKELSYFCAIHPEMQGSITIEPSPPR